MSFLLGPTPPKTDLEIVLDFLFEAVEGWSAQFRTTEITRKMYDAAQAFQRMKEAGNHALPQAQGGSERAALNAPQPSVQEGENGKEEAAEKRGEDDPVLNAKKLAARERMAKARAARDRNVAARKAASGA